MATTLNELRDAVGKWAEDKGWNDKPRSVGEDIALMHSELSEALEEHRNGLKPHEQYFIPLDDGGTKPEGIPIEIADVLIRIFHFAAKYSIDLDDAYKTKMDYNAQRAYRHGNKVI